jgi:hypothetical protein
MPAESAPADAAFPGADFVAAAARARASGDFSGIPEEALRRVMTAAVKLYMARAEADGSRPPLVTADEITPTEIVVVVSQLVRAAGLNLFDLSMWLQRAE